MIRRIPQIALFAALSSIGAFIRIPLPGGVFLTMQVAFVIMSGLLLGPRDGTIAQALYIVMGLTGLPIFSKGGGPHYALTYEFGYLLGFLALAFITGFVFYRLKGGFISALVSSAAGVIVFYVVALPYIYGLSVFILAKPLTIDVLIKAFCLAFLPVDALKVALAAFFGEQVIRRLPAEMLPNPRKI